GLGTPTSCFRGFASCRCGALVGLRPPRPSSLALPVQPPTPQRAPPPPTHRHQPPKAQTTQGDSAEVVIPSPSLEGTSTSWALTLEPNQGPLPLPPHGLPATSCDARPDWR